MKPKILILTFFLFASFLGYTQSPDLFRPNKEEINTFIQKISKLNSAKKPFARADSINYYHGDDSLSQQPYQKELYYYNRYGQIIAIIVMDYETDHWQNSKKIVLNYFPGTSKIESYLSFPWNTDTQQWEDTMSFYKFSQDDNILCFFYKIWNPVNNVYTLGFRTDYYYLNENQTILLSKNWRNNQWQYYYKTEITKTIYSDYYETLIIEQTYDTIANEWKNSKKYLKKFNNANQNTYRLEQSWDANLNAWRNSILENWQFRSDTLKTLYKHREWDTINFIWIITQMDSIYYSPALDTSIYFRYRYNSTDGTLLPTSKTFTVYLTPLDKELENIYYNFDRSSNSFIPFSRSYKTYGQYGLSLHVFQRWDNNNSIWKNIYKDVFVYYPSGLMRNKFEYLWDNNTSDWVNYSQSYYEYTSYGYLTLSESYFWDDNSNLWQKEAYNTYEYNSYKLLLKEIDKVLYNGTWTDIYKKYITYLNDTLEKTRIRYKQTSNPQWKSRETYYTFTTVSDVEEPNQNVFLYPNPAQNYLIIHIPEEQINSIIIFDMQGSVVERIRPKSNRINITNLAKGVYIIKVSSDKSDYLLRLIKN